MKLVHYSADIVTQVKGNRQQDPLKMTREQRGRSHTGKPRGFWLSDESRGAYGWRAWSRDNRFARWRFRYKHEVELVPNAKILYIRTAEQLRKFDAKYGYSLLDRMDVRHGEVPFHQRHGFPVHNDAVEWWRLTRRYHGIIITPYIWSERLGSVGWYYSWDCASGCIWNPRAIASIKMVAEYKVPRKPTYWEARRAHKRDVAWLKKATEELRIGITQLDAAKAEKVPT
jgi:hypothetical protein